MRSLICDDDGRSLYRGSRRVWDTELREKSGSVPAKMLWIVIEWCRAGRTAVHLGTSLGSGWLE